MAFFPNTADPAPIILHHTPSDTATPALLYPGETAVCHGPTRTKFWIGDGTTNRLFLSTNPADSPLLNQAALGGPFLPLSGGTLAGPGNLTLDGGTLTVSGATPTVVWDRTGTDPAQWELRAQGEVWSMYEGGELLFRTSRNAAVTPTVYTSKFFNRLEVTPYLAVDGGAMFSGHLQAIGVGGAGTGITASRLIVNEATALNGGAAVAHHVHINGSVPMLRITELTPVTGPRALAEIWACGVAGVDNSVAYGQSIIGAGIRFNATQGWQRDDGPVDQLGAQIDFWVSRNGGPSTYRAMTLEQDGALRLSSDNPAVVWDKTATEPRQWELRTVNDASGSAFWGLREGGAWAFHINRDDGPLYTAQVSGRLRVTGDSYFVNTYAQHITGNSVTANGGMQSTTGNVLSQREANDPATAPVFRTQRWRTTGNNQAGDILGTLLFSSRAQDGSIWSAAAIHAVAAEPHDISIVGTELQFWTTLNGTNGNRHAMTLGQDGALRLSSDNPAVIWDVTGANPLQWALRFETITTYWGLTESNNWLFWLNKLSSTSYRWTVDVPVGFHRGSITLGGAQIYNGLNVYDGALGLFDGRFTITADTPDMFFLPRDPITAGNWPLGQMWGYGWAGIDNTPDLTPIPIYPSPIAGAGIRFLSTQQWERDTTMDYGVDPPVITSQVDQLGAEIAFFVSENDGPQPYRAMTLQNDGSLTVVGAVTASGSLLTSDPDLKDDIAQAPSGALAKVCELPVIDYRWKHGRDSKMHRGFSADDVRRVMGEDSGCAAEGAYSLADMNAMLWRAVQELSEEVQELKRRVH